MNTVKLWIGEKQLSITFVGLPGADGVCQVNGRMVHPEEAGMILRASVGPTFSDGIEIEIE